MTLALHHDGVIGARIGTIADRFSPDPGLVGLFPKTSAGSTRFFYNSAKASTGEIRVAR
jgi:hypothetical protein